jgi:hypothetical protein
MEDPTVAVGENHAVVSVGHRDRKALQNRTCRTDEPTVIVEVLVVGQVDVDTLLQPTCRGSLPRAFDDRA